MATLPLRASARVIVLDEHDRLLLLRYKDADHDGRSYWYWATPGGSLEAGEDHEQAARRELLEELGVGDVDLGPQIAVRTRQHTVGGLPTHQVERYYILRVNAADLDAAAEHATQPDQIQARRWWRINELSTTSQTVYPTRLADLVSDFLARGAPEQPTELSG